MTQFSRLGSNGYGVRFVSLVPVVIGPTIALISLTPATINVYDLGDLVRVSAVFEDSAGTTIDPDAVSFKVFPPSGPVVTYAYDGTDTSPVVKDSVGNYHYDLNMNAKGTWFWRWVSTGFGQAAEDGECVVRPSVFS